MHRGRQTSSAYKVAFIGMLFALAIVLSFVEATLTPFFGLMPAVKIGLANIVVMYAVLYIGRGAALTLVVLKALFALLTRGVTAGALSLCGGVLSWLVLCLLLVLPVRPTAYMLSVLSAISHNVGQLAGARVILGSNAVWGYLPVLLVAGLLVGSLNWLLLNTLTPYFKRWNKIK